MAADDHNNLGQIITDAQMRIASVITQVSTMESIMNGIIAHYYTKCPAGGDTQRIYLQFVTDVLWEMPLGTKIKMLFKIFERTDNKQRIKTYKYERKTHQDVFNSWKNIRNKFAHGIPFDGRLYLSGSFHDIIENADVFFKYHQVVSRVLESYRELWPPYLILPLASSQVNKVNNKESK